LRKPAPRFSEGGGLYRPFAEEQRHFFSSVGMVGWLVVGSAILFLLGFVLYGLAWRIEQRR
jgi:hypothetical protein